jgi:hypothetical protein
MEETAIFRPAKRGKFIRSHGSRADDEVDAPVVVSSSALDQDAGHEDSNVSSILRLRRQQRSHATGVRFSNSRTATVEDVAGTTALVPADDPLDTIKGIADRFVGHSGQVVDVDKHMCVPPNPWPGR